MSDIVKVVVDLPLRKVDKEFDYMVPDDISSDLKLGQLVKVPFGRRKISAFITSLNQEAEIDKSKIKNIDSIIYQKPFFDKKLLTFFRWISAYYHSYLIQVIKTALPPGILNGKIKRKEEKFIKIKENNINYDEILNTLDGRAPKQYQIFKYLTENTDKEINVKNAADYADTSIQTVSRLIEKGYIESYNKYIDRIPEFERKYFENDNNLKQYSASNFMSDDSKEIINNIVQKSAGKEKTRLLLESNGLNINFSFYYRLIEKYLKDKKSVILLVPEIEKYYVFLRKTKEKFSENAAFLHSRLSDRERFDEWRRIQRGDVNLVVGARSAVFAPLKNLDLIIIRDENSRSYKQIEHPLYHARQIAAKRCSIENASLVLEAAFPSIESMYSAQNKSFKLIGDSRNKKYKIKTKIIDMRHEIEKGNLSDLSFYLKDKIEKKLNNNKKTLLFLNRRGYGSYVICKKCGSVIGCDKCDISMSYHQKNDKLYCHYCGSEKEMPEKCPECGSSFISPSGIGTENIVEQLRNFYPQASINRLDADSRDQFNKTINAFKNNKIDVLVATQIIIKKDIFTDLDFLAVINADTALNSADFRAAANSFNQLNELKNLLKDNSKSEFIIQTFNPKHFSIQTASESDYSAFYKKELEIRRKRNYPPFCRLLNIIIQGKNKGEVKNTAYRLDNYLSTLKHYYIEKLGVSRAVLKKIRNKHRWQIILKFDSIRNREYIIQSIENKFKSGDNLNQEIEIRIDVDPYRML